MLHFTKKVQNPKKSSYLKTRNKKDDNIPHVYRIRIKLGGKEDMKRKKGIN